MMTLPPSPFAQILCPGGPSAPFFVLPFDKHGNCEAPATRARLLEELAAGRYTDVFVFSHGWNNDWPRALSSYQHFINGFTAMVRSRQLALPAPFRPLLLGIHWPSAALTFGDEAAPSMAGAEPRLDAPVTTTDDGLRELAASLPPSDAARFTALVQQTRISQAEAFELAELAAPLYAGDDDELPNAGAPTPAEIVDAWQALAPPPAHPFDAFGVAGGGVADPSAAGEFAQFLDPRWIVRGLTVYQMKDRAGVVGASGVGPLLRELLDTTVIRIHAVGHSYGCRVLLSAICFGDGWPRPLHSLLLMQGAISHLSFAADIDGKELPGGYRRALDRVFRPILCTFSRNDVPLHRLFHLILRRERDVGELQIAAAGEPPNRFAALGGYGPRRSGERLVNVLDPAAIAAGRRYELSSLIPLIGIDATATIGGHGDFSNLSTYWMLYNLITS